MESETPKSVDGRLAENVRTDHTFLGTRRVSCVSGELVRRVVVECGSCGPIDRHVKQI